RRHKLHALIQREGISSQMKDTRWMRLIEALREADLPLRYRIKLLTDPEASDWDTGFAPVAANYIELPKLGPVLALEVEWLEIDSVGPWPPSQPYHVITDPVDYSEEVATLLGTARVPFTIDGS